MLCGTAIQGKALQKRNPFRRKGATPPLHFALVERELVMFSRERNKERRSPLLYSSPFFPEFARHLLFFFSVPGVRMHTEYTHSAFAPRWDLVMFGRHPRHCIFSVWLEDLCYVNRRHNKASRNLKMGLQLWPHQLTQVLLSHSHRETSFLSGIMHITAPSIPRIVAAFTRIRRLPAVPDEAYSSNIIGQCAQVYVYI